MKTVAILGAGELGATLARVLLDREAARRVVLVDPDESRAQGKALDLRQAGPVERSDTLVEGRAGLKGAGTCDAIVVADPPELELEATALRLEDYARGLAPLLGTSPLVIARDAPGALVDAAVSVGLPAARVAGSAPIAWSSALRRALALELGIAARDVAATAVGQPPHLAAIGVSAGGLDPESLPAPALRRALERVASRRFGPVALASAAAVVLKALANDPPTLLPVSVSRGAGPALAWPSRVGARGIVPAEDVRLDPRARVALENAAARR
jgi:hypothetical protein